MHKPCSSPLYLLHILETLRCRAQLLTQREVSALCGLAETVYCRAIRHLRSSDTKVSDVTFHSGTDIKIQIGITILVEQFRLNNLPCDADSVAIVSAEMQARAVELRSLLHVNLVRMHTIDEHSSLNTVLAVADTFTLISRR